MEDGRAKEWKTAKNDEPCGRLAPTVVRLIAITMANALDVPTCQSRVYCL